MNNAIVIDLETMDVRPSALILSIGAFAFDLFDLDETRKSILEVSRNPELVEYSANAFYALVDANDQLMLGRSVGKDTQFWWKQQATDAIEALEGKRETLATQLLNLSNWMSQHKNARVYFRGTDFDGSILESAYKSCGINCPWKYNGKRDVRTYIDAMTKDTCGYIAGHSPVFQMIKHHALHDAMSDAEQLAIAASLHDDEAA